MCEPGEQINPAEAQSAGELPAAFPPRRCSATVREFMLKEKRKAADRE
jgi:hypothetical protein